MTIRTRLNRLEARQRAHGGAGEHWPGREIMARECQCLARWLAERGLTAQEALAAGLNGPPELRYMTLAVAAEAHRELEELEARYYEGQGQN